MSGQEVSLFLLKTRLIKWDLYWVTRGFSRTAMLSSSQSLWEEEEQSWWVEKSLSHEVSVRSAAALHIDGFHVKMMRFVIFCHAWFLHSVQIHCSENDWTGTPGHFHPFSIIEFFPMVLFKGHICTNFTLLEVFMSTFSLLGCTLTYSQFEMIHVGINVFFEIFDLTEY